MMRMTMLCRTRFARGVVAPVAVGRRLHGSFTGDTVGLSGTYGRRARLGSPARHHLSRVPCHPLAPRRLPFASRTCGAFASTPVCLRQAQKTAPTPSPSKAFDVTNLGTYPPYSDANVALLVDAINARRGAHGPASTAVTRDNVRMAVFIIYWKAKDSEGMAAIHRLMIDSLIPESKGETVIRLLDDALDNGGDRSGMQLAERGFFVTDMERFIRQAAFIGSLQKTTIFCLCSTRGSGKTQFLKNCLYGVAREDILGGSVLLVECGTPKSPFRSAFKKLGAKPLVMESDIVKFVTSLIRAHVKERWGVTLERPATATIPDACAEWAKYVKYGGTRSKMMFVFDTVEALPETGIDRWDSQGTRSFIEALAFLIPSQSGILAVGTKGVEAGKIGGHSIIVRESKVPWGPRDTLL